MRHKHAEVLIAIAEGKDVEWRLKGDDEWHIAQFLPYTPLTNPEFEWRIKPDPKPDVVMYAIASMNEVDIGRRSVDPDDWASVLTNLETSDDNLKLTFCGETGKLKSAEVLKCA
jgi:hypothetical protein